MKHTQKKKKKRGSLQGKSPSSLSRLSGVTCSTAHSCQRHQHTWAVSREKGREPLTSLLLYSVGDLNKKSSSLFSSGNSGPTEEDFANSGGKNWRSGWWWKGFDGRSCVWRWRHELCLRMWLNQSQSSDPLRLVCQLHCSHQPERDSRGRP